MSLLTTFPQSYRTHQRTALSHTPSLIHTLTLTLRHTNPFAYSHTHSYSSVWSQPQPHIFTHSPLTSTNTKHPHSQTPLHSRTLSYIHRAFQQHPQVHNHVFEHRVQTHRLSQAFSNPPLSLSHTYPHTHTPFHTYTHTCSADSPASVSAQRVWDPPRQTRLEAEGGREPFSSSPPRPPRAPSPVRGQQGCRPGARPPLPAPHQR